MERTPHVVLLMSELSLCLLLIIDLILRVHTDMYAYWHMCVHVHVHICLSERLCVPDTERESVREYVCVRACDTTNITTKYLTLIAQINNNNCICFHNALQYCDSCIIMVQKTHCEICFTDFETRFNP
jgi:hypothetical protein